MSEREINTGNNESFPQKMARGCIFLTQKEAKLLYLRNGRQRKNISATIQNLIQPRIDRLKNTTPEERESMLKGYLGQVISRSEIGLESFETGNSPPFIEVNWVLPKTFIDMIGNVADLGRLSSESLMSCMLSDVLNMRESS